MVNVIQPKGFLWSIFDGTHVSNTSLAVRLQRGDWSSPSNSRVAPREPESNQMFSDMLERFGAPGSKAHD
jgi:hypothetical protein